MTAATKATVRRVAAGQPPGVGYVILDGGDGMRKRAERPTAEGEVSQVIVLNPPVPPDHVSLMHAEKLDP